MNHDPVQRDLARYQAEEAREAQKDLVVEAAYLDFLKWHDADDALIWFRKVDLTGEEEQELLNLAARIYARRQVGKK